jgi:hypothetical protein
MRFFSASVALGVFALGMFAASPSEEKFKTRLAPVAIDLAMQTRIAGSGLVSATLNGTKLSVSGSFEGLRSAATEARIHQGLATGVRGAAVLDLTVEHATSGTISGSFDLTAEQIENLRKGRFYIQISSEKAPEGNLWGWLLK